MRHVFVLAGVLVLATRPALAQQPATGRVMLEVGIRIGGVRGTIGTDTVDGWANSRPIFFQRGTRVAYALRVASGYRNFWVRVDSSRGDTAATGTIAMDRDHVLMAMSERVPSVVPQNKALFDVIVQILRARDPTPIIPRYFAEFGCLDEWYGPSRSGDLLEDADGAAHEAVPDSAAWKRFSAALERKTTGMSLFVPPPPCTRPRPADALPKSATLKPGVSARAGETPPPAAPPSASSGAARPAASAAPTPRPDSVTLRAAYRANTIRGTIGRDSVGRTGQATVFRFARGGRVTYAFAPTPDYQTIGVSLESGRLAASGTITMDNDHTLAVSGVHRPYVVARNRALYELNLQMVRSSEPETLFVKQMSEMKCLEEWYGRDVSQDLEDGATGAATEAVRDSAAWRRMNARIEATLSARGAWALLGAPEKCTKLRPRDATQPVKRPPGVSRENRELYNIYREMIASKEPATLFQRLSDEIGCLVQWYGAERGEQLARDAAGKAAADAGEPDADTRLGRALNGASVEARDCTKKKPR